MPTSSDITRLVSDLTAGNRAAVDSLMPLVYDELRVIASRHMQRERADHTLDTTGLIHEAYLSLLKNERLDWQGRAHLLSMAAIAMRRILVDYARRRATDKRGSGLAIITLDDSLLPHESRPEEFISLDEALTSLNTHCARDWPPSNCSCARPARCLELPVSRFRRSEDVDNLELEGRVSLSWCPSQSVVRRDGSRTTVNHSNGPTVSIDDPVLRYADLVHVLAHSCREAGAALISANSRDLERIQRIFSFDFVAPYPKLL